MADEAGEQEAPPEEAPPAEEAPAEEAPAEAPAEGGDEEEAPAEPGEDGKEPEEGEAQLPEGEVVEGAEPEVEGQGEPPTGEETEKAPEEEPKELRDSIKSEAGSDKFPMGMGEAAEEMPGEAVLSDEAMDRLGLTKSSLIRMESGEVIKSQEGLSALDKKKEAAAKKKLHALGSVISIRRGNAEFYDRSKIPRYMNTYKLEPEKPFHSEKVEKILVDVLAEAMEQLTYDPETIPKQVKWASSAIRAKVKELEYDRYKIVCVVTIGEKISQDALTIFRFLWDGERDRYAKAVHENMTLYAIAMCFGLYYE